MSSDKQIKKANKKVAKGLAVFEQAADKLYDAAATKLTVADALDAKAEQILDEASQAYDAASVANVAALRAEVDAAYTKFYAARDARDQAALVAAEQADALKAQASKLDDEAFNAEVQADSIRALLAV